MSYYLTEDPTYILVALGVAALACLIALQVSQQGKFLVWAGGLIVVAAVVFGVEQFWVTDAERIEAVVYDMVQAVETSDVPRIESHLDAKVSLGLKGQSLGTLIPLRSMLPMLRRIHFDFTKVSHLTTQAGEQTRQGTAEFKVMASGTVDEGGIGMNFPAKTTAWSLGFRETSPKVWKVTRITAIDLPGYIVPGFTGGR